MNTRMFPIAVLSLLITALLLLAMYSMIKMQAPALTAKPSIKLPIINADIDTPDPIINEGKPLAPIEAMQAPPPIDFVPINDTAIEGDVLLGQLPDIGRGLKDILKNGTGEILPILKVPAVYPNRAIQQNLCGWVELSYTVSADGRVKDIIVTASSSRIFERSSVQAVSKYKYKPRIRGGSGVEVNNVRERLVFQLEEGC